MGVYGKTFQILYAKLPGFCKCVVNPNGKNSTIKSTNNDTNISDWNDIDNVSTRNNKRQKHIINYNESPSSLLNSAKKRKKKKKYKLKTQKYN